MLYHIITTPDCNLCCEYCCGKAFDEPEDTGPNAPKFEPVPQKISYPLSDLDAFLAKDSTDVILTFYGGEPLMQLDKIKEIMDYFWTPEGKKQPHVKTTIKHFMLQTNGILLNRLTPRYANLFHTILVSVDGDKIRTDKNRGTGTYERIMNNIKKIKEEGFAGELIARMTIEEPTHAFDDITYLAKNPDFSFTSIHWQLDANMWHDYERRNFSAWHILYNKDITKLADFWVHELAKGNVLRIYPFLGVLDSIMNGEKYGMRCGSGNENFTIITSGKIAVCPIMSGVASNYVGDIWKSNPRDVQHKISVGEPCTSCSELELCGGRCLFSNLYPPWPQKGVNEVCHTAKHLITEMRRIAPQVQALLKKGVITKEQLKIIKYNGAEIIP